MHEYLLHDYWKENTSSDIFYFSVSVTKLEFQAIGFLACHFFIIFIQKMNSNAHFDSVFTNFGQFIKKKANAVRFFHNKNKNMYKFYAFTIKTDLRYMSENREFILIKQSKTVSEYPLCHLFLIKPLHLLDTIKVYRFFIVKIRIRKNCVFTINSAFGNMSESCQFRFENSLKQ